MNISSRTPEGRPNRCPTCGKDVQLDPSADSVSIADAPCPHCGCLIWFEGQSPAERRDAVHKTKTLISDWVRQFTKLSKSATDPVEYLQEMLNGLVWVLAAHGGAIWTRNPQGLQLRFGVGIDSRMISRCSVLDPMHALLIESAFSEDQSLAVQPDSPDQSGADNGNTTGLLLMFGPVKRQSQTVALVEVFQRVGSSGNVQRGYLRFLQQMCEIATSSNVVSKSHFGS